MSRLFAAAEDHFGLIDLSGPADDVLPGIEEMGRVAIAAQLLAYHWEFLWDLRELGETVYNDTIEAFEGVWSESPATQSASGGACSESGPRLLVPPGRADEVSDAFRKLKVRTIEMLPKRLPRHEVALEPFLEPDSVTAHIDIERAAQAGAVTAEVIVRALAGPQTEWGPVAEDLIEQPWLRELAADDYFWATRHAERVLSLDRALRLGVTRSVLTQLAVHSVGGAIHVTPYHGGGLHQTVGSTDDAVLLRPARVHRRYWAAFRRQILRLEELLNEPRVRERDIENLLEANPLFLNSLGYERIYHQVVLPRDGASDLRPDVIAEPADSEWAEVVDLKLPSTSVVVGRQDRAAMSAALTEAVAQLREYAAFFDDRSAAAEIEERLGLRCYRPKLTVIIGRDPRRFSAEQRRRALTAHPDLRVVTYDDLIRAARTRLLL